MQLGAAVSTTGLADASTLTVEGCASCASPLAVKLILPANRNIIASTIITSEFLFFIVAPLSQLNFVSNATSYADL